MYNRGMAENAKLAPVIYGSDCRVRVYHDDQITVADELRSLGVHLVKMQRAPGAKAMSWRFIPMSDPRIDYVIVRDCDSRLGSREAAAVREWIASGKKAHSMADFEHHRSYALFGGMIGCKGGTLPDMPKWIDQWPSEWGNRMTDMLLLQRHALPILLNSMCRHTSVPNPWGGEPFPPHEPWCDEDGRAYFVGQQHDANGRGIWP